MRRRRRGGRRDRGAGAEQTPADPRRKCGLLDRARAGTRRCPGRPGRSSRVGGAGRPIRAGRPGRRRCGPRPAEKGRPRPGRTVHDHPCTTTPSTTARRRSAGAGRLDQPPVPKGPSRSDAPSLAQLTSSTPWKFGTEEWGVGFVQQRRVGGARGALVAFLAVGAFVVGLATDRARAVPPERTARGARWSSPVSASCRSSSSGHGMPAIPRRRIRRARARRPFAASAGCPRPPRSRSPSPPSPSRPPSTGPSPADADFCRSYLPRMEHPMSSDPPHPPCRRHRCRPARRSRHGRGPGPVRSPPTSRCA